MEQEQFCTATGSRLRGTACSTPSTLYEYLHRITADAPLYIQTTQSTSSHGQSRALTMMTEIVSMIHRPLVWSGQAKLIPRQIGSVARPIPEQWELNFQLVFDFTTVVMNCVTLAFYAAYYGKQGGGLLQKDDSLILVHNNTSRVLDKLYGGNKILSSLIKDSNVNDHHHDHFSSVVCRGVLLEEGLTWQMRLQSNQLHKNGKLKSESESYRTKRRSQSMHGRGGISPPARLWCNRYTSSS